MNRPWFDTALALAKSLGATNAELVFTRDTSLEIDVSKAEVETLAVSESIGAGARLLTHDGRMGFAYVTELDAGPEALVTAAWHNALASDPDTHNVLLDSQGNSEDDWSDEDFGDIPVERKVEFAKRLEQLTLDAHPNITSVPSANYSDASYEARLVNSRGLDRQFRSSICTCTVQATAGAENTDSESGWEFDAARTFAALRPDWVAQRCAERAVRLLGAEPVPTQQAALVLDNYVTTQFLGIIGSGLLASNVLKGKSPFAGQIGNTIAAPCISFVDQNNHPQGLNRAPFDGEGTPAQTTHVIEAGVLRNFLHNAYTAHRLGTVTTANAVRGSFRSMPEVGPTNFYLKPGSFGQDDLVTQVGEGIFVTSVMGVHTADPISGDFSFGASGRIITGGALGRPFRGVTVAGNIRDILKNTTAVGGDLRFFGSYGAPSVVVQGVMVSGK